MSIAAQTAKLCRFHLDTVVMLTSRQFIIDWLKETDLEKIQHEEPAAQEDQPSPDQPKSKRGRRPGAASEHARCIWALHNKGQCKNAKQDGSEYCKMHVTKAALIAESPADDASSSS
jgi:hypothetical protein